MQRIERYGVIALVFLLVTIVAVSLWGEREESDGWFSFLDRESKTARIEQLLAEASAEPAQDEELVSRRGVSEPGVRLSGPWAQTDGHAYGGPGAVSDVFNPYRVDEGDSSIAPLDLSDDLPPFRSSDNPVQREETVREPDPVVETPSAKPAREYTIRSGDTLSEIAMRELGTKDRWRELVELNPGLDPARLQVGTKIRLGGEARPAPSVADSKPAVAEATKPKPSSAGGSYTIRSGDTLSHIAMRELGTKDRWRELVELNPGLDPARLSVGATIRLPGGAAAPVSTPAPRETRVAKAETPAPATQRRSKVR